MSHHYLYRHFDAKGKLLYVGISLSATYRLSQHKQASPWFGEIARVEIEKCETRAQALEKERVAIVEEKPTHNLMRPSIAALKELRKSESKSEESKQELIKRIVNFDPTYSLDEAGHALGVGTSTIKKWIEEKKLGYVVVGYATGKWGTSEKKRITGWQLIDFIEYLERAKAPQEKPNIVNLQTCRKRT